jgi:hypothetical protein
MDRIFAHFLHWTRIKAKRLRSIILDLVRNWEDLCMDVNMQKHKNSNWKVGIRQQGWSQLKQNSHQLGRNNIENRGESTYAKRVQRYFSASRYHLGGPSSPKSSLTFSVTSGGTGETEL